MSRQFTVRLTCCGRDDGRHGPVDWHDADTFRKAYLSGPGVLDPKYPERGGHERSAIIEPVHELTMGGGTTCADEGCDECFGS